MHSSSAGPATGRYGRHWLPITALLIFAATAFAHEPPGGLILHLPFDGSLENRGSLPAAGELIGKGGEPAGSQPEFREGRFGQAIYFPGGQAVRVPLDLSYEFYPQVTITAWVYPEGDAHGYVLSNRANSGPTISVSKTGVNARGPDSQPGESGILRPGRWTFVAGVWDTAAGELTLYYGRRSETVEMSDRIRNGAMDIWIGAWDDSLISDLENIRVDDVRVYDRALTAEELEGLWLGQAVAETSSAGASGGSLIGTLPSASDIEQGLGAQVGSLGERSTVGGTTEVERMLAEGRDAAASAGEAGDGNAATPGLAAPEEVAAEVRPFIGLGLADDYSISSRSGSSGSGSSLLDMVDAPIRKLRVKVKGSTARIPCEVSLESEPAGRFRHQSANGSFERFSPGNCGPFLSIESPDLYKNAIVSEYDEGYYTRSLRVCQSGNGRVKGLQTSAVRIVLDQDSNQIEFRDTDVREVTFPACDTWSGIVRCGDGQVASGVRIYYDEANDQGLAEVKGLALICRRVVGVYE